MYYLITVIPFILIITSILGLLLSRKNLISTFRFDNNILSIGTSESAIGLIFIIFCLLFTV